MFVEKRQVLEATHRQAVPPSRADAAPSAAMPLVATTLRLFVVGFGDVEKRLLAGVVQLSQRRQPRLQLLGEAEAQLADVVLVDGSDAKAVRWAEACPWLPAKTVIWVDSPVSRPGCTLTKRPVQWPILPMLLARAMESRAPLAAVAAQPASPTPAAIGAVEAPRRMLVIDDSLAVRNHLRSLLEARGMQVMEADCVRAGLDMVGKHHFDGVLMDVLMPDLDGYEGCKRIKAMKSKIGALPVVMLTSKSSPFDRIRGKMAGCDAYLTKPVEPAQLYEVLVQHAGVTAAPAPARSLFP